MTTPSAAGIVMPQPRVLNFGTTLTANMLAKMTVTYEVNVHRDEDSEIGMQARLTRPNVVVGTLGVWWLAGLGQSQTNKCAGFGSDPNKHIY